MKQNYITSLLLTLFTLSVFASTGKDSLAVKERKTSIREKGKIILQFKRIAGELPGYEQIALKEVLFMTWKKISFLMMIYNIEKQYRGSTFLAMRSRSSQI